MSTKKQSTELSDVAETAESNRKSGTPLIKKTEIKGSPFMFIENTVTGENFITLGRHIIKDQIVNIEEAEAELPNVNNWEMLLKIISAVTIMTYEQIIDKP